MGRRCSQKKSSHTIAIDDQGPHVRHSRAPPLHGVFSSSRTSWEPAVALRAPFWSPEPMLRAARESTDERPCTPIPKSVDPGWWAQNHRPTHTAFCEGLDKGLYFDYIGTMDVESAVAALGALAQGSRLAVFRLLVQRGPTGLAAGEISERVGVPPTTLSFHLAQLSHAGLVTARRESRSIIYAADYDGMQHLMNFLTENCCTRGLLSCGPPASLKPTQPKRRK
jgi:ArsR family transcriptional regulator